MSFTCPHTRRDANHGPRSSIVHNGGETMRRLLAAAAVLSCVCAFMGCRHIAGVCDCAPLPGLNYWGCPGCTGVGVPPVMPPAPALAQPEPVKVAPLAQPEPVKVTPKEEAPK